jgi:hypothetical protein
MHLTHKDWLKVPILLESLRGLFEELSDQELDNLKELAKVKAKKVSETPLRYQNIPTGILP